VIFAFSVFSHLTERCTSSGSRVRPGAPARGSLIVTTRSGIHPRRAAIREQENDLTSVSNSTHRTVGARSALLGHPGCLERYDTGEYCCDPIGAGEDLPSANYGETAIPFAYVQRRWGRISASSSSSTPYPE